MVKKLKRTMEQARQQIASLLNGYPEKRLPSTLNISIRWIVGEQLLSQMLEIAASTGSVCNVVSTEPSSVLLEMGLGRELALGTLRLSLGRWSTPEEIDTAAEIIVERTKQLQKRKT